MAHVWDVSGIENDEVEERELRMHPSESFP